MIEISRPRPTFNPASDTILVASMEQAKQLYREYGYHFYNPFCDAIDCADLDTLTKFVGEAIGVPVSSELRSELQDAVRIDVYREWIKGEVKR